MDEPAEIEVLIGDGAGTRAPTDQSLIADVTDIEIGGEDLRRFLREIIGKFFITAPPVEPSLSDILSVYLMEFSEDFRQVRDDVVALSVTMDAIKSDSDRYRKLLIEHSRLMSRRDEIINETVVSADFRRHMAQSKTRYNDEKRIYLDLADCVEQLKPYLGFPKLPSIKVPSVEPLIVLQAIKEFGKVRPFPDEMVMMGEEPFYSYPQFSARSVYHTGINPKLAKNHIFVPFSKESKEGVEALAEGAFAKAGRLAFRVVDNRPAASSDWRKIDSLLPFAARSITVPLVPLVMPQSASMVDIPTLFGQEWWKAFQSELLTRHAEVCQICGGIKGVEATPSWRFIEPPRETTAPGLMVLDAFYLMCGDCRFAFRPSLEKSFSTLHGKPVAEPDLRARISLVNRWTDPGTEPYAAKVFELMIDAFERRSAMRWLVNLSLLAGQPLRLDPAFVIDDNGWVKREGVAHDAFKIVGASFYDRAIERHLYPAPKVFRTRWGHTLAEAIEFIQQASDDLVVEDTTLSTFPPPGSGSQEPQGASSTDEDDEDAADEEKPEDAESAEIRIEDMFGRAPLDDDNHYDDDIPEEDDDQEVDPEVAAINRQLAAGEIKFE